MSTKQVVGGGGILYGAHTTQFKIHDAINSGVVAGCTMPALESSGGRPDCYYEKATGVVLLLQLTTAPGALSLPSA